MTDDTLLLAPETHFRPLGLHHFYDAFSLDGRASLRQDALVQFELEEHELTSDLRLTATAVARKEWELHPEQPKAPPARTARRDLVPPGVINPDQGEEEKGELDEVPDGSSTDSEDSDDDQDETSESTTRTPLSEDVHQHGLMLAAYRAVGTTFTVKNGLLKDGLDALQAFESVPRRWPLARLTVPLLKCVEHLDRVMAGCCWEVIINRKHRDESLGSLRQVAKSLTLMLAGYLAEFVAEIFRVVLAYQGSPLTDEENVHLLGTNYWIQPIYQELLHAASGHNAIAYKEKERGLAVGLSKLWRS